MLYGFYLYRIREKLEENEKSCGTLYDGLRITIPTAHGQKSRPNSVWFYPIAFMLRRSMFIVITVIFFDYPMFQMPANQVLSVLYIAYLSQNNLFESKLRMSIEIASEFICLIACVFLQIFLLGLSPE